MAWVRYYFAGGKGRAEQIRLALSELGVAWAMKDCTKDEFVAMKPQLAFGCVSTSLSFVVPDLIWKLNSLICSLTH